MAGAGSRVSVWLRAFGGSSGPAKGSFSTVLQVHK